jgi:hypothetical protein
VATNDPKNPTGGPLKIDTCVIRKYTEMQFSAGGDNDESHTLSVGHHDVTRVSHHLYPGALLQLIMNYFDDTPCLAAQRTKSRRSPAAHVLREVPFFAPD